MAVEAIVFDFDGVIIDTETPDFETWRDVFRARGLDLSADLWLQRVGSVADDPHFSPAKHYLALTGTPLEEDVQLQQRAAYLDRCARQPVLPGVVALLDYARAHGVRLAIASNSFRPWVEEYATRGGVWDYFECVHTLTEVPNGKPAPDLYVRAAACLGVPVERCLAIEDSPTGMQAAIAARIRVVAVPNPLTAALPRPADVALTLNGLTDLSPAALLSRF